MKQLILIVLLSLSFTHAQLGSMTGSERAAGQIGSALDDFFGAGGETTVSPEQAAAVDASVFDYQYDEAATRDIHSQFITTLSNSGVEIDVPTVQAALTEFDLAQQQQIVDALFPGEGFKANNMIDIFAITLIANYLMYQGEQESMPEADRAVRDLLKVAFTQTPGGAALSNYDKQFTTEGLFLSLIFALSAYEEALAGSPGSDMAQVKENAKQMLMSFGLHPRLIKLGPTGLEQTPEFLAVAPQIESGELTFEQAMPDVFADFMASQNSATPLMPGVNGALADAQDSATPSPTVPTTPSVPATPSSSTPTTPTTNPLAPPSSSAPNPLAATATDPYIGSYAGDNISLTLTGSSDLYEGELIFNGQTFPVQAYADLETNRLIGDFTSGADTFSFVATLEGTTLSLDSDGNLFNLERQTPVNPLGN